MGDRSSEWEVMRDRTGAVHQAGIPSYSKTHRYITDNVQGLMIRGVVLQTYFADEDDRTGWVKDTQTNVLCDVRTIGRNSRVLVKVPILQRTHGLWDRDIYIPRGSRQDINGGTLSTGSAAEGAAPTAAEDLDGDQVIVGFLENDPQQPIVLPFMLGHPKSNYKPEKADGRVKEVRHAGVGIFWTEDGNLTIDATQAAKEELGAKGAEQSNSGTTGTITIITNDGSDDLSLILDATNGEATLLSPTKVHLNTPLTELSDSVTDAVILGDAYNSKLNSYLNGVNALVAVCKEQYKALAGASSVPPLIVYQPMFTALTASWEAFALIVSTYQGSQASWLSTKVKTG